MNQLTEVQDPNHWIPANASNGELFAKFDQVAGVVRLTQMEGHFIQLDNGDWSLSAEGYRACNIVAGIPCITPDTMKLPDGREVCNPYVEFDPDTGTADKFWSHKVTIGKSPIGNLVVSAATVLFDVRLRFVKELVRKIDADKDAGKLCMDGTLDDEEQRSGIYMPFQGKLGVYGRHDNRNVIECIHNLITNKEHGDKIVQTLAWKASIKQQPSMPSAKLKVLNGAASVLVVGYKLDFDEQQMTEISKEYKETGTVSGAEVIETAGNASEETDISGEYSLLSTEGGIRF